MMCVYVRRGKLEGLFARQVWRNRDAPSRVRDAHFERDSLAFSSHVFDYKFDDDLTRPSIGQVFVSSNGDNLSQSGLCFSPGSNIPERQG